jgi:hypothetical protein
MSILCPVSAAASSHVPLHPSELYVPVMGNFDHLADVIDGCMSGAIAARSFDDLAGLGTNLPHGSQVMCTLASVLFESVVTFNAQAYHPHPDALPDA